MTLRFSVFRVLIFIFCIGTSISGFSNYATHYYTVNNGLSSNTINSIYQDKSGYIWIGTDDGLNLFDGYTFRVFRNDPGNSKSLHHNKIIFIQEDSKGNLWVGTSTSLSKYNAYNNTFTNFFVGEIDKGYILAPSNPIQNRFTMFEMDDKDILWTSIGNGLLQINLNNNTVQSFDQPANAGKIINHILRLNNNEILIGSSDGGLDVLNLSNHKIKHLNTLDQSNISFLAKSENEKIWIGSYGKGAGILDLKKDKLETLEIEDHISQKYRLNNVLCGLKTKKNEIYIGNESGLFSYKNKSFSLSADSTFFSSKSLVSYGTRYIMEDKDGNLWIGTYREGLVYIQKNASGFSVLKDMLPSSDKNLGYVNAIIQDGKNILIASGERGLIIFDTGSKKFSCYTKGEAPFNLQSRELCFLFKHSSGKLWIGSANAGVHLYDPATKKSKTFAFAPLDKNYNSGNQTMAILEDDDKNIWIATEGDGIKIIDPNDYSVKCLRHDPSASGTIASNWVRSLAKDREGNIWIGTVWGLSKYNKAKNKIFTFLADESQPTKLQDNTITHILEGQKGKLWFATAKGLHQLSNPFASEKVYSFKNYSTQNGLSNNTIHALAEDLNGNIWMTSNGGISMLNINNNTFINYPFADLPINFFCEKSACVTDKGMILFGGINKLIYFDPKNIQSTNNKVEAQISELRLFNKLVLPGDTINDRVLLNNSINNISSLELEYEENVLSFLLSAIYYEDPNGLEYSYQMEGFNKEWLHTNAGNRLITYTHLAPGNYTFHVKAKNRNGLEIGKEKTLSITILPPWWRNNIAYFFYLCVFIFLLWLYRYITLKQLKLKQEVELQKAAVEKQEELIGAKMEFYTNVSHEFKTPLTLIQGPIDKLIREDKNEERQNLYGLMKQNTLRLRKYIDEILLFRKIQTQNQELKISHNDFLLFVQPIVDSFRFQAQTRNIAFEVITHNKSIYAWFDEDKMEKILMNLISNAVKYTPENGKVKLEIESTNGDENIKITVSDSGPGIPKNEQEKIFDEFYQSKVNASIEGIGIGLSLVKSLISLHKGSISLISENGEGTTFMVIIPIQKTAYQNNEISETKINQSVETVQYISPVSKNISAKTSYKILIVDDNNDIRSFLKSELENSYNILEAENGKRALAAALEYRPDIILSDVMMPEMDGFELCKAIKTNEELSATPLILLTAKTSEESMLSGLEFGADDYISKPFNIDILQIKVRNILQQVEKIKQLWKNLGPVTNNENAAINVSNEFVTKLIAGIETHLENVDLTPALLAQTIGISRTKLYGMVAEHTSYSVIDFIYIIRLRKAAELLATGKYTVSEVSWKVGFKQHSHFTKRFSEHFGKAPSSLIP